MLMNNPLVQSPGWWSLPKKKRFEMASAQSMLSPLAQVRTPQYDHTMGAGAGPKTPQTPMAGKKGATAEERAEAWTQALVDAQDFMGPMPGDTITGGAVGHRVEGGGIYETAGGDPQTAGLLSAAPEAFWKKKLWT